MRLFVVVCWWFAVWCVSVCVCCVLFNVCVCCGSLIDVCCLSFVVCVVCLLVFCLIAVFGMSVVLG